MQYNAIDATSAPFKDGSILIQTYLLLEKKNTTDIVIVFLVAECSNCCLLCSRCHCQALWFSPLLLSNHYLLYHQYISIERNTHISIEPSAVVVLSSTVDGANTSSSQPWIGGWKFWIDGNISQRTMEKWMG